MHECLTTCWSCKAFLVRFKPLQCDREHNHTESYSHHLGYLNRAALLPSSHIINEINWLLALTQFNQPQRSIKCEIKVQLTSPSSPGSAEVTTKSFPLESKALISMPQLVSGCRSHTVSTCLTSILCHEPTPALTSIFRERIRMCLLPSVTGMRREICRNTLVASAAGRKYTQSCARTTRLAWNFCVMEKKQHLGSPSTWTMVSAGEGHGERGLSVVADRVWLIPTDNNKLVYLKIYDTISEIY